MARARCPVCRRLGVPEPGVAPFPFCSDRCRLLDLDNWLGGRYVVTEALPFDEGSDLLGEDDELARDLQ